MGAVWKHLNYPPAGSLYDCKSASTSQLMTSNCISCWAAQNLHPCSHKVCCGNKNKSRPRSGQRSLELKVMQVAKFSANLERLSMKGWIVFTHGLRGRV